MVGENIFDDYAVKIWNNEPFIAEDRIRWHTSDYHIQPKQLTIDDAVADAHECLDVGIPEEIGIPVSIEEWYNNYFDNPKMIAAMARLIYNNLKEYGRYAFDENPDWGDVTKKYVGDSL